MRAAIGTGLFDKFPATGDITLDELAKATNADAALLGGFPVSSEHLWYSFT
jgi:hypothetical protein